MMAPPMMAPPMMSGYGAPGAAVQQTTTSYGTPAMSAVGGVGSYLPVVSSCFGRPVQLFNHYGKFLCGGTNNPHGHHNPNHGFSQSSFWFIEPMDGFSGMVRLRNSNGLYLCHIGGSPFCSMHPVSSVSDVAWHMEMFPNFDGQNVMFRSHGGMFLSLDKHDSGVHCKPTGFFGGPHVAQRFEIRYC